MVLFRERPWPRPRPPALGGVGQPSLGRGAGAAAGVVFGGVVYTSAHPERPAQRSAQKATSLQRACQQLPCCQRECVTLQPP